MTFGRRSDVTTYLITGGTGSFGRAFIADLLADPAYACRVVSVSRNAEQRYRLQQVHRDDGRLIVWPGDVRYASDLYEVAQRLCQDAPIDVIIHAAAEKHVGTGEQFQRLVRQVNLHGTQHVIHLALTYQAGRVLLLSTDKACEPTTYYGYTKRWAEEAVIDANRQRTRLSCVRYGNVIASSGSVIPLFLEQRTQGRVTVTDLRATRFFMPLSDSTRMQAVQGVRREPVMSAVRWVHTALQLMHGGEIFVPRIPSGTILNIAQELAPDCVVEEIGLRGDEKLHEVLIGADEVSRTRILADEYGYVITPPWATVWDALPLVAPSFRYSSDVGQLPVQFEEARSCASR